MIGKETVKCCLLSIPNDIVTNGCTDPETVVEPDDRDSKASLLDFLQYLSHEDGFKSLSRVEVVDCGE